MYMKLDNKNINKKPNKISTDNSINNSNKISNEDFNSQLYKLLSNENKNQDDVCLITNLPLENEFVMLKCNHKFNYNSIFNEVTKQKCHHNQLETTRLKKNEIKCPYCRTIQEGLLPYKSGFLKTTLVNHPEKMQYLPNSCIYAFLSGKKKGKECGKKCSKKYCKNHKQIINNRKMKIEKAEQCVEADPKATCPVKLDNVASQNIIITPTVGCKYIYKRGKKKHLQCSCKKIFDITLCKTHWKQVNKINIISI